MAQMDIEKLNRLFKDLPAEQANQFKVVVTDRDINFSKKIDFLLNSDFGPIFTAIGMSHLPEIGDSKGVIALLKEKGWDIIPVYPNTK
jgi:hypothetical protein